MKKGEKEHEVISHFFIFLQILIFLIILIIPIIFIIPILSQAKFAQQLNLKVASHLPRLAGLGVYGRPFFASGRRWVEMDSSAWPQRHFQANARAEGLRLGGSAILGRNIFFEAQEEVFHDDVFLFWYIMSY